MVCLPHSPAEVKRENSDPIVNISSRRTALMPARRFPPPWSIDELEACFVVKDSAEQVLALQPHAAQESPQAGTQGAFGATVPVAFGTTSTTKASVQFAAILREKCAGAVVFPDHCVGYRCRIAFHQTHDDALCLFEVPNVHTVGP